MSDEPPPVDDHPLLRKSKLHTLKTVTKFLMAVIVIVFLLWIVMSILGSNISSNPLFFPIHSFILQVWLLLLIVNVTLMALHGLKIKWTDKEKEALWYISDYGNTAKAVIAVCIFLVIVFGYPPIMGAVQDMMKKEDSHIDITDLTYKFSSGDPMNISSVYSVEVSSVAGQVFNATIVTQQSYDDNGDCSGERVWRGSNNNAYIFEEKLGYGDFVMCIESEDDIDVDILIDRKVDPVLLDYFLWFPVAIMIANIVWSVALFAARQGKIKKFIAKEQAKLQKAFQIEEVFLIYQDGRLIAHNTRRLKADVDKDILTGMLTAVQNFVSESFQKDEVGVLDEMHYGNLNILIENGPSANMAVVVHGEEPKDMRKKMKGILKEIHEMFGPYLAQWDGDTTALEETKKIIGEITPPAPPHVGQSSVEEAFLFHRDGRFIYHVTQRLGPDVDDELLKETVHYIDEKVGPTQNALPQSLPHNLPYGDWNIILEYAPDAYLAALLSGPMPKGFRAQMQKVLEDVTMAHGDTLYQWDGSMTGLTDLRKILESLFIRMQLKAKRRG
jgi:hypothetical protein